MLEKYFVRPLVAALLRLLLGVEVRGQEHARAAGKRVLIVSNHVSFLDPMLVGAFLPFKAAYAINVFQAERPLFRWLDYCFKLYRLDPTKPISMKAVIQDLRKEARVVLFPEGRITTTGGIMKVYDGAGMLLEKTGATLLPMHIEGAERSKVSRLGGKFRQCWLPKIRITFLPPVAFEQGKEVPGHVVYDILTNARFVARNRHQNILEKMLEAAQLHGAGRGIALDGVSRASLSYRQLFTRAFVLAGKLQKPLAGQDNVAMLLPTSAGAMVTLTALFSMEKIPCLLNFSAGEANMLHACAVAQVKTVLTARSFVEKAKLEEVVAALEKQHKVIYLEDIKPQITLANKLCALARARYAKQALAGVVARQKQDMPAVVLYTSGSEGTPKGVVLSHGNILSNVAQFNAILDLNPSDNLFNALPVFHSFGLVVGTLTPLLCGIRSVQYPSPLHYRVVPELVYDTDATILLGTDTFYNGYARYANGYDFWRVRLAVAGAEKVRQPTRQLYMQRFRLPITEGYGVTEASPVVSVNTPVYSKDGSVGRLLPGIKAKLEKVDGLDEGARLLISGPNVMMGYLKADKPGVIQPPGEWYDTGDIVDIDEAGFIHILGRAKRFAKVGGEMVSLTAVEELGFHLSPDSAHAATAIPDERKGEQVLLYTEDAKLTREALLALAREKGIAEIILPKQVKHIEAIPRLGNGKVDYVALAKLAAGA